jgi:tetratricopeptide (TPR) repeat protein
MDTVHVAPQASAAQPRLRLTLVALTSVLLAAGAAWYAWRWYTTPQAPEIDVSSAKDPALARAVDEARQQVAANPRSATAWGRLGQLLLVHAYVVEAKPCLIQAEDLDATDARWPYLQGWGSLLNHPEEAAPCFQRAVSRCTGDPAFAETARLRLAQTLQEQGEFEQADAQFRALLDSPMAAPTAHLGLGTVALDRGDLQAAVNHLQSATGSALSHHRASARLAAAYRRQGNRALAEEWDRRARQVRKDVEWPDPFLREMEELVVGQQMRMIRAENRQRDGQLNEAAARFQELIADYPDDTRARQKLALVLIDLGKHDDAEQVLRELLRIDPKMAQGHFLLSTELFRRAEQYAANPAESGRAKAQFEAAAESARRALALQPYHGLAHVYLGLSLKHLGQLEAALGALENAARCSPELVDPHLHYGQALAQAGRRDQAIAQLKAAVRVAPPSDGRPREALQRLLAEP